MPRHAEKAIKRRKHREEGDLGKLSIPANTRAVHASQQVSTTGDCGTLTKEQSVRHFGQYNCLSITSASITFLLPAHLIWY